MTEDNLIIQAVLNGDTECFRELVEKYQNQVTRMIRNILSNHYYCEDIAQDVFFTAYKKLKRFNPERGNFSTWLFTIARNKSLNAIKRKKAVTIESIPADKTGYEQQDSLAQQELFEKLDNALESLPSKQRQAFVLAEFENLSYEKIARIEQTRVGTIKSRISRAKENLRGALKDVSGEVL